MPTTPAAAAPNHSSADSDAGCGFRKPSFTTAASTSHTYTAPRNPATNVAVYPSVTVVTWVASQKLVSSTACIISSVSSVARLCATIVVVSPRMPATALPMPSGYSFSSTIPSITQPQPMNTADEYRFVTNTSGRSIRLIRTSSAPVWMMRVAYSTHDADFRSASPHAGFSAALRTNPNTDMTNTMMYSAVHCMNGENRLYVVSSFAFPSSRPLTWSRYFAW